MGASDASPSTRSPEGPPDRSGLSVDRRTFLKVTAVAAAGLVVAPGVLAQSPDPVTIAPAADPILGKALELGLDRDRIHRFVSDEIAYEPYAGMLRGPATTLAGRAGNAADKAALLAALLGASMIETRFASGTLDAAAAATLTALTVDRTAAKTRAEAALRGTATPPPAPAPDPAAQAIIDRLPEIDAAVTAWAASAIDASVVTITAALADAGLTLPMDPAPLPAVERDRHLWVQARSGTDWVDLDPTLPGSQTGSTIAVPAGEPLTAVPDDLRHRLDIEIILERIKGGALVQEPLIEHSAFADELTDVPISIGHAKPESIKALGVSIGTALTGGVQYLTILQVGTTAIVGTTPLLLAGDPSSGADPFGLAGDREDEAVAEWLELRITSPDGTSTVTRRTLFDRVGDAARMAGPIDPAVIPVAELVDLDPEHPDEYLPLATARFLSVATGATRWPTADIPDGQELLALGIPVRMYHVTRDVTNATLSLDRGVAVHLAAPNVTMQTYEIAVAVDGSRTLLESLDLLHRGFGTRRVADGPADVPAGVLAGVTSHIAERLRGGAGMPADLAPRAADVSVGALFEQAAAQGIGLRVLHGSLPAAADYRPEATGRLAEALAEGWVAIVPERPVAIGGTERLGWWLVDPTTGATRDEMDNGRGSVMVENTVLLTIGTWQAGTWAGLKVLCQAGYMSGFAISLQIGATVIPVVTCQ